MEDSERGRVLLDTSVLINFLAIERIALLALHPDYRFDITEHVRSEVTIHYKTQLDRLEAALHAGHLEETRVETMEELMLFAKLSQNPRLGLGECAAIAAAIHRKQPLAIDDKAARKAALELVPGLVVIDTQGIMVSLIRANLLSIAEADSIKSTWAADHRFHLKVASFAELL